MKKTVLFLVLTLFFSACNKVESQKLAGNKENSVLQAQENQKIANLSNYHSKELGLSFQYSSDLKVYQQDEDNILIKAPYSNLEYSLAVIQMSITKTNSPQLATKKNIDSLLKSLGQTTIEQGYKNNYQVLKTSTISQYYFLGNKGTFIVSDSLEGHWKDIYQKEGVYEIYRSEFDALRNSINFD